MNWFKIHDKITKNSKILNISRPDELDLKKLSKFNPNIIFFPHWNWYVKEEIFQNFICIGFHTAPLPFGRGGSPIQNLILKGFKVTPVCAIKMTQELDAGPIYDKKEISLEGNLSEILGRLNEATNYLIMKLVNKLPEPTTQNGEIIKFNRLSRKDNEIKSCFSYEQIYDHIRMLDDKTYPSSYIKFNNAIFEFFETEKSENEISCKVKITKI